MMEKKRMFLPTAAIAAVGLVAAACSSSDDKTATMPTDPPMVSGCDTSMTSQACVDDKKAALDAATKALEALQDDDDATQGQIKAAEKAVGDAMKAHDDAMTARSMYIAMQAPMYDMKAMGTAIKAEMALMAADDTPPVAIDGGMPPMDNEMYSKGTWPVDKITGFTEAVYQSTTTDIVTHTDKSAAMGAKYSEYYADGTEEPGDAIKTGYTNKPWDGGIEASADGVISFGDDVTDAPISLSHGAGASSVKTLTGDDDLTTDADETMFSMKGMFHGIPGTFKCTGATATDNVCTAGADAKGMLTSLAGGDSDDGWTFTPDKNTGDMMVDGVLLDADYLDFGYWVTTTTGTDGPTYTVGTFAGGMTATTVTPSNAISATYKGGAAGLYTKRESSGTGDGDLTGAGRFTADANLKAYFGTFNIPGNDGTAMEVSDSIRGTIGNFMDGGQSIDATWSVDLVGGVADGGLITPDTTMDDLVSATFYGGGVDAVPTAISGEFDATFNNGEVIGAFGARKQ